MRFRSVKGAFLFRMLGFPVRCARNTRIGSLRNGELAGFIGVLMLIDAPACPPFIPPETVTRRVDLALPNGILSGIWGGQLSKRRVG